MLGTAKTVNHPDFRSRLYAGFECLPHQNGRILADGSLANPAHYCHYHHFHHHRVPYLEAQA